VGSTESDERGLGADFPGPVARVLLRVIVSPDRRDEFEGDLIEEAEAIVLPGACRRVALRWFWRQLAASAPPMLARRFTKEVAMHPRRWIIPAALVLAWGLFGLADLRNASNAGFDWGRSVVLRVEAGGPAERAGLRTGDRILSMGGIPIDDLRALQQQPRAAIGETRVLVVERTDAAAGTPATQTIPLTYGPEPARNALRSILSRVIAVVFLLSGMIAYLRAPSTTTFVFAVVGLCFGAAMLPGPYIRAYAPRTLLSYGSLLAFLAGSAALLHLMLVFPRRKAVTERKWVMQVVYLPVAVILLIGIPFLVAGPWEGGSTVSLAIGAVLLGYIVLSVLALIHSYLKATPQDRRHEGLNVLLAGFVVGFVPIGASVVAGVFTRVDLLPGAGYYFMTLVLTPISIAYALVKGAGKASEATAAEAV